MRYRFLPIFSLLFLAAAAPALAQCGGCPAASDCSAMNTTGKPGDSARTDDSMPDMHAEAASKLYMAAALYTCPAHAEVISADAKAVCPLTGDKLVRMSDEAVAALRAQKLMGCPMCSIVMPAGAEGEALKDAAMKCAVCGMDLVALEKPDPKTMAGMEKKAAGRFHSDDSRVME
ncbi:MAG: hypothetical protein JW819_04125 [Candidatus Krumholzibacteriota bacterium]|nr:hypothetical protein [Candidatus Krumholzibacteriota bacterium]